MVRRLYRGLILAGLLVSFGVEVSAFPRTLQQRKRLQTYLPHTFHKLEASQPIHVVLIGDGNLYGESPNRKEKKSGDILNSYSGIFLNKVAREFFYTGGVRLLNPPKGVLPKMANESHGVEIQIENLATPYTGVLAGMQRVKSDAFVNDPDLIIIQYGSSDALNHTSIDTYRRALHHILEECRKNQVDVILLGPTPVNRGGGAMEWGITRPYATAARGMAKANRVLFIDTGRMLVRHGGAADFEVEPLAGTAVIGDRLKRIFYNAEAKRQNEILHINYETHQDLGKKLFYELMDGSPPPGLSVEGKAEFAENGAVRVVATIQNPGRNEVKGIIGALALDGLTPTDAARRYSLAAGKTAEMVFEYTRPEVGKTAAGLPMWYPLEIDDEVLRFPFIIEDGVKSDFIELPLRVAPVSVTWKSKQYVNITTRMKIDWEFANSSDKVVKGTYRIGKGAIIGEPQEFSVAPLARKANSAIFPFDSPAGKDRFHEDLFLELNIGGQKYRFSRVIEASRDLALGEKVSLVSQADYGGAPAGVVPRRNPNTPTVVFDAVADSKNPAKSGLYAVIDLNGQDVPDAGEQAALRVLLTVDARPRGVVRSFGGVSPVVIYLQKTPGKNGYTSSLPLGAFGDGYNMRLQNSGITSILKGSQIQIKIPKSYLHLHDWDFKSGQSLMGVRLELSIADLTNRNNPFPPEKTFVTHQPSLVYQNQTIRGMTSEDARGLSTLRFSRQPMNSWSVRVY